MNQASLTLSEIEELGYYDFMAYLEVPFFNIGGPPSMDLLAERCRIDKDSIVLDVGCGTGGNAVYIAEHFGCRVRGVDISKPMVEQAKRRSTELGLNDRVDFQVGDAYNLDFADDSFNVVTTIFVSQFLDVNRAFPEFRRVLKPGGYLGINEMYKDGNIPLEDSGKAEYAEQVFRELTDLPFKIRPPENWEKGFLDAGFSDVSVEPFREFLDVKGGLEIIRGLGGWGKLLQILWMTCSLGLRSRKIRERYGKLNEAKRVMLRDQKTSRYFGYVLGVGKK